MTELSSSNITLPSPQMSTTDLDINQTNMELSWLQRLRKNFPSYLVAVDYLLLLSVAESLIALEAPQPGMILHGVILATLLLHASIVKRVDERRFLRAMALAPLIRLLSMTLPLALFQVTFWYVVVGVPLLIASLLVARIAGITRSMAGLTLRALPEQVLIGLSGFALGYLEYLILRPAPLVASLSWELLWLPALILLVFTGFLEELIFRGLLQAAAMQHLGRFGMPYVAVTFAVLHLGYRSALDILFVFVVGLIFGSIVRRRGTILGVSLAHGLTNVALYLVFPFILTQPVVRLGTLRRFFPHQAMLG